MGWESNRFFRENFIKCARLPSTSFSNCETAVRNSKRTKTAVWSTGYKLKCKWSWTAFVRSVTSKWTRTIDGRFRQTELQNRQLHWSVKLGRGVWTWVTRGNESLNSGTDDRRRRQFFVLRADEARLCPGVILISSSANGKRKPSWSRAHDRAAFCVYLLQRYYGLTNSGNENMVAAVKKA